ncbi:MAG: methyl-accepting chemotaxis protein [Anaerolineales bacterium]|nr:methyl-accepting chemotaxis protein [Anaerolineales bacterium]
MNNSRIAQVRSLKTTIVLWAGLCLLVTGGVLATYAAFTVRSMATQNAIEQAQTQAREIASQIDTEIEIAMDAVRTTAGILKTTKDKKNPVVLNRQQVSWMIRQLIVENPSLTGASTLWEPNAFDGKDREYVNRPPDHDATGRFLPYWHWDEKGNPVVEPLTDYETSEWVVCPKTTKNECITEPYIYPINGVDVLMTTVVAPVVVDVTYHGIVTADIDLQFLQQYFAERIKVFGGAGELAIISNKGMLAGVTGKPYLVGKMISEYSADHERILRAIQGNKADYFTRQGNLEVVTPFVIGKSYTPWGVMVRIPLSAITASANRLTLQMVLIGLVLIAAGMVAIWWAMGFTVAKPLAKLRAAAAKMAEGDVEGIVLNELIQRQDEIGEVGRAFDQLSQYFSDIAQVSQKVAKGDLTAAVQPRSERDILGTSIAAMIRSLRSVILSLAQNASGLREAADQLAAVATESGQATNQIAATMQQVARGAAQQSQSVNRTAVAAEQMSRAIDGVARGAQEQAMSVAKASTLTSQISSTVQQVAGNAQVLLRTADQSRQAALEGAKTVGETVRGMAEIKNKVSVSAARVEEMGKRSQQIGAIVETIEDIASQTNLLALNAAIEAARAGEHGKGFAVVADEVRKLAERSSQATKEIAALVKSIQQSVQEAVSAMNDGAREVESGVEKAEQAGQSLTEILKSADSVREQAELTAKAARQMDAATNELVSAMDAVSAVVEQNTAATEEMSASANEVTEAVENIASVSEENSAAIEEVSASAEQMSAQAQEVMASAQTLAQMAQALQELVQRFRMNEDGVEKAVAEGELEVAEV